MGKKPKSKHQDRETTPKIVQPPTEIAANIERITSEDRQWFEMHPGEDERIRPAAPGEFWPVFDSVNVRYVIVTQVQPGHRLRCPVLRMHRPETGRVQ